MSKAVQYAEMMTRLCGGLPLDAYNEIQAAFSAAAADAERLSTAEKLFRRALPYVALPADLRADIRAWLFSETTAGEG